MARWEPNAQERLRSAALDLFVRQGYEATTAADIAAAAGLGKSTFFRHFADKREVLFGGQDELLRLITAAVAAAPDDVEVLDAVAAGLLATSEVFTSGRRPWARRRQPVIDATVELRERDLLKRRAMTDAMASALVARGVAETDAALAAELGSLAFRTAYARWTGPGRERAFTDLVTQAVDEVRTAAGALANRP